LLASVTANFSTRDLKEPLAPEDFMPKRKHERTDAEIAEDLAIRLSVIAIKDPTILN
jgi:hypothetical protein